jgi:hypothetical protein
LIRGSYININTPVALYPDRLRYLDRLTRDIGERSVRAPHNLDRASDYIRAVYEEAGLVPEREGYDYHGSRVANIVARIGAGPRTRDGISWGPITIPRPAQTGLTTTPARWPSSWRRPGPLRAVRPGCRIRPKRNDCL